MPKFTKLGDDEYQKPEETLQDILNEDTEKVISALEGFVKIPHQYCDNLVLGSKIRYITEEGLFRVGGTLIKNGFPEYIVLLNGYKKITWSVNLRSNTIFMEDIKAKNKIKEEKENLYKLYKADMLHVKD